MTTPEEDIQLQTVNHKLRTAVLGAILIGVIAFATLYAAFK